MTGRVTDHRRLLKTVKSAGFTIRRNAAAGGAWWVHYNDNGQYIPSDQAHTDLVDVVNQLKLFGQQSEGGAFSINEYSQVVVVTSAATGHGGSEQIIAVDAGVVYRYASVITFGNGALDPTVTPNEGEPWTGPHCGVSYTFAAPGATHAPSRKQDEVSMELEGATVQLSVDAGVNPYPPPTGLLFDFLKALRRHLPVGGRFRVNEHRRAFTSNTKTFIGLVPHTPWFAPLDSRS